MISERLNTRLSRSTERRKSRTTPAVAYMTWPVLKSCPEETDAPPKPLAVERGPTLGVGSLDVEPELGPANDRDSVTDVRSTLASRRPDLARDANLAIWPAGGDDCRRLSEKRLRTDYLAVATHGAVPKKELSDEQDQAGGKCDEIPRRRQHQQEDNCDDQQHR